MRTARLALTALIATGLVAVSLAPVQAAGTIDSLVLPGIPSDVAFSPDGTTAWVPSGTGNSVQRINVGSFAVTGNYPLVGAGNHVAVSPTGAMVAVTIDGGSVSFLNTATGAVLNTQTTGALPWGVVFSPDGGRAFIANWNAQTISVINTSTWANIGTLDIMDGVTHVTPSSLVMTASGTLWVAGYTSGKLHPLNSATLAWGTPRPFIATPENITLSPDGSTIYGVSPLTDTLGVFDVATQSLADTATVGNDPTDVAPAYDSDYLYVANGGDSTVSIVDARTLEEVQATPLPNSPGAIATSSVGTTYATLPFAARLVEFGTLPTRIAGADRFDTAVRISQAAFPGTVDTVYVATGQNYPDALAAGPAAAHDNAPLLLTATAFLPDVVRDELERLDPDRIIVLGNTSAVSAAVEDDLEDIAPVERYAGADRYETARIIVRETFGISTQAYIATGANFPDALSAGAGGAALDVPIILVNGAASSIDGETLDLLDSLGVEGVLVLGGPTTVSPGVFSGLSEYAPLRIAGADRFETSRLFNRYLYGSAEQAVFATGLNFPDALAGAALAAAWGAPLYTVLPDCVPHSTLGELYRQDVERVTLLGGTTTLSESIEYFRSC